MRRQKSIDVVAGDGDAIVVTIRLRRWEAGHLASIVAEAAAKPGVTPYQGHRWRALAKALNQACKPQPKYNRRYRVIRPSGTYPNHLDMDHVVNGSPPYPVLSVPDLQTVWPQLEAKGLSALHIAKRLHVAQRTVNRWRRLAAKGEQE